MPAISSSWPSTPGPIAVEGSAQGLLTSSWSWLLCQVTYGSEGDCLRGTVSTLCSHLRRLVEHPGLFAVKMQPLFVLRGFVDVHPETRREDVLRFRRGATNRIYSQRHIAFMSSLLYIQARSGFRGATAVQMQSR